MLTYNKKRPQHVRPRNLIELVYQWVACLTDMSGNLFVTFQSHFPTFFDIWWHSMTFSHIFSHIWSHFKSNIWSHFWWHLITFHHIPVPFFWYFQHFQTFDNIGRTYASHSMTFSANICSHFRQPNFNIYQHSITFRHLHLP